MQGHPQAEFAERMFVYNYRLYDRYHRPVASMAVLADDSEHWQPGVFGFEALGCRHTLEFPTAKLLAHAGREEALLSDPNPFALVTLAHLLTRATRQDMPARFAAKWKLVQLLYRRGWEKQRIIDLFSVLDWMMRLPDQLSRQLWQNIEVIEEKEKMRYVTSVERLYMEKGRQQGIEQGIERGIEQGIERGIERGIQQGESRVLARQLTRRFGELPAWVQTRLAQAAEAELEAWSDAVLTAGSLEAVFGEPPLQH